MPHRALHRCAAVTALCTWLLLITGSLVTSNDAGLAVPDWPLSYGMLFPPMVGGILYEHGHRMIAGVVALMILALAVWLARAEPRPWVRRLGWTAVAGVACQALLGGLTVLLLLPPAVSIAHACLGQVVFCCVVLLAWATAQGGADAHDDGPSVRMRRASLAVVAVACGQLVLGAVIRHTGRGVGWHAAGAGALAACVGVMFMSARSCAGQARRHARRLAALLAVQLAAGAAVWAHRSLVPVRTLHVTVGALVLAQAIVLAADVWRGRWARLRRRMADYLELTKPRLSSLVLVTAAVGFWLGAPSPAPRAAFLLTLLGTGLVAGGANALNQWAERAADAVMQRTRHRPLPDGRLAPESAFRFGSALIALGLALLGLRVNWLAASLAAASAGTYLFGYTPLKRRTAFCTLVGAIPGALPPVIGWAGARGALGIEAGALFALLFLWQLPHFLALAELFRQDYARAGFRMLTLVGPDGRLAARQLALYGLALVPASLFPALLELCGPRYFYSALGLSAAFCALSARAAWTRSLPAMRAVFSASIAYLSLLLVLLAADKRVG